MLIDDPFINSLSSSIIMTVRGAVRSNVGHSQSTSVLCSFTKSPAPAESHLIVPLRTMDIYPSISIGKPKFKCQEQRLSDDSSLRNVACTELQFLIAVWLIESPTKIESVAEHGEHSRSKQRLPDMPKKEGQMWLVYVAADVSCQISNCSIR